VELSLNAKCTGDTTMDIYTRDLIKSGHGTIGTPVIAGMPYLQLFIFTSLDAEGKGVLICKLRRGQELRIKCVAKKVLE
jgi:DNA-directed RNA polymerase II subunit RPB3